jgi:hypothetical protein
LTAAARQLRALDVRVAAITGDINKPADCARIVTVTQRTYKTWRTVGSPQGNSYFNALVPELPLELNPTRLDMGIWPVLEKLGKLTGNTCYGELLNGMTRAFAEHGFDAKSGLGYLGQEAEFDVVQLTPLGVVGYPEPKFKPAADLPLERLWSAAPQQMTRMFKAAYYGLITRPATMDYNRFCSYDFDDREKKIAHAFNPQHVAFAQTAAMLIHYWAFHFARSGDTESLAWAQAMANKWSAVQHPETGLAWIFHKFSCAQTVRSHSHPTSVG